MAIYKRVLVKLSGEALKDHESRQIFDKQTLTNVAQAIQRMVKKDVQVCLVVGAGNIWRGKLGSEIGIEQTTADYMGMMGTMINALALQAVIEQHGMSCRVLSAIKADEVSEPYIRRRAIRHLEKNRVVIFAGGTGNPYFTTDTTASLRAKECNCDAILMAKNNVEGVMTSDPRVDNNAKLIKHLTYADLLKKELAVMDQTAVSLLRNSNIETRVFNMTNIENFDKVISGEEIGTTIKD